MLGIHLLYILSSEKQKLTFLSKVTKMSFYELILLSSHHLCLMSHPDQGFYDIEISDNKLNLIKSWLGELHGNLSMYPSFK